MSIASECVILLKCMMVSFMLLKSRALHAIVNMLGDVSNRHPQWVGEGGIGDFGAQSMVCSSRRR